MKKSMLALAMLSPLVASQSAQAEVTAYGRVLYDIVKDDTSDDLYFGRHEFAESTIGVKGSVEYNELTFGAQVEIGLDEGVSNILHDGTNSRNRIQEIWVQGKFGKVKMGTGASITWIVSDVDQSGTWWSDPLGMSQRFGSTRRGPVGESQTPFVQTQSIFSERIVYESPTFLDGAKFYAQYGEDSSYEMAIKYAANGWRVNAWSTDFGDADNDEDPQANIDGNSTAGFLGAESGYGILAGYLHDSGVNFSATYGVADQVDGGDRDFLNWKLGYTQGKHAVSYSMGNYASEDAAGIEGPDHTRTTVAYHFSPVGGVSFWVQATKGDTDEEESFNAFALGGMVRF
ncbi:hypothetical protein Patl_2295 [Paraglaciecola sp. T6c]|uniref:porin n=1 Tax=Pseudoalteromonas atlantica (strain T6c / ATCC BAA-1087) TaxID=3042615 RepID=UPI00005C563C|nr:porin [Paraglaciecola sp. T6c]ABG40812.1 hypothetical protein Patl_2295 [Paraglaciecola sp. T6c]